MDTRVHGESSEWAAILDRAVAASGEHRDGLSVFREAREDLVVELEAGRPVVRHTALHGVAARGPFDASREFFLSDPFPEEVLSLVRAAVDPRRSTVAGGRPVAAEVARAVLAPSRALACLTAALDRAAELDSSVRLRAMWVEFEQRVQVASMGRPAVQDRRRGCRVRLEAYLGSPQARAGAVAEVALGPGEDPGPRVDELCHRVIRRARHRLHARAAPVGECAAVFAPGVAGVLIHELIGHALEADTVLAGRSWLAALDPRESAASPELVVVDDPRRARAAWRFDDEGEPARAISLLRGGRVAGWIHDRRSALESGHATTGHGRRASFRDPVRPRMGCTFLAAGTIDPEEIVAETASGIYVRRMEAARTDPKTGSAIFRITDADRIDGGRIVAPLHPLLMELEGRAMLRDLDCIGSDLVFDPCVGSCHRDGQPLAISVGAPTLRVGMVRVVC